MRLDKLSQIELLALIVTELRFARGEAEATGFVEQRNANPDATPAADKVPTEDKLVPDPV